MNFSVENLNFSYDKHVLNNLTFATDRSQVTTFLGPSGCGKSTLLKVLAGLEQPTSGTLLGFIENKKSFVFQDPQLLPWLTVYENICLPLKLNTLPVDQDHVSKLISLVSLTEATNLYPHQLSGGMKMRVSIARSLITNPQLIFLDEPFSALDEITREILQYETYQIIKSNKISCFFVTHSIAEAVFMSDNIFILNHTGKIIHQQKNPLTLARNFELRFSNEFQATVKGLQTLFRSSLV